MVKVKSRSKKEVRSIRESYSKGELAKEILKGLAVGGLIVASFALPNLPQVFSFFGIKSAKDRYRLKRTIQLLEKQKLIEIYEKGDEQVMEITEKGKKRILKYKFDELTITRPKKWDGLWRVIAFDIPQKYKRARDAFSFKLKEMEFYHLQKSIYVCPFECRDEVDFIGEIFDVRKYINYFVAKEIDEEEKIKKYYDL